MFCSGSLDIYEQLVSSVKLLSIREKSILFSIKFKSQFGFCSFQHVITLSVHWGGSLALLQPINKHQLIFFSSPLQSMWTSESLCCDIWMFLPDGVSREVFPVSHSLSWQTSLQIHSSLNFFPPLPLLLYAHWGLKCAPAAAAVMVLHLTAAAPIRCDRGIHLNTSCIRSHL